jgi:hypothetical protein
LTSANDRQFPITVQAIPAKFAGFAGQSTGNSDKICRLCQSQSTLSWKHANRKDEKMVFQSQNGLPAIL